MMPRSFIFLTHSFFHCGKTASMAAKLWYVCTKEGKGVTLVQHHLTSQKFIVQSCEFYVQ